jgi:hypothetical protein
MTDYDHDKKGETKMKRIILGLMFVFIGGVNCCCEDNTEIII